MGFLDHSTNNIIVDAVLTDRGRELLAAQNGAALSGFKIEKFSLSDDEVDYTIIEKYGRTVGKEKIIKNTPIFEAQTKALLAQKYRMISLESPSQLYMPTLTVSPAGALNFNATVRTIRLNVATAISAGRVVPPEIVDDEFYVILPKKLLTIGQSALDTDESTALDISTYAVRTSVNSLGQNTTVANIDFTKQSSIDDTLFTVYGTGSTIKTIISIIGADSGARADISVSITK
jgi:hypothetical protein